MAIVMTNLGFEPKGRGTIRRVPSADREPRRISPWAFQPKEGSTLSKLEQVYLIALQSVDAVEQRKADAIASKKFTDDGIAADVLQFAASTLAPKLHSARLIVEAAKTEAQARRAKLTLPVDKDAYAFALRQRKLEYLLKLPQKERDATFLREQLDPDIERAVVELGLPADVIGIPASALDLIKDRALRAVHGAELDELAQLDEGIAIAEDAVAAAREAVAYDAGGLNKFASAAAPYERAAGAPWLRKARRYPPNGNGEEIIVMMVCENGKWRSRPATEEEIAIGVFYENGEAYQRAQAGDFTQTEKANGHAA